MTARFDLEKVLVALRAEQAAEREAAADALLKHGRLGLNTVEGLRALQAAAEPWPAREGGRDTACELVWAAARTPRHVYVPVLEESFERYGAKARVDALRLLLRIGDRRAAQAWLGLADRHASELGALGLDALLDEPRQLDVLFPAALSLLVHPPLVAEVCDATCALCAEQELFPERLVPQVGRVLSAEERHRRAMAGLRGEQESGWEKQAEYLQARSARSALLDLLGWLPGDEVEQALRAALPEPDRRVKAFAVVALVRRRASVEQRHLAELEADPELRGWLRSRLDEARRQAGN